MRRLWPCALLVAGLAAGRAEAAACCLSSSAFGLGRLASWEHSAVLLGVSTSPVLGRWDATGAWRPNAAAFAENEWRWQLSALLALHPRLQVSGRLPMVLTVRETQGLRAAGGGLGDGQLGLRIEPIFQGEYGWVPELALNIGVTFPSGRLADGSAPPEQLGTEVTGRGAWILSASATAELARDKWFVQAGGGITAPIPMPTPGGGVQRFGLGAQATLAGGLEPVKNLTVSVLLRFAYEGNLWVEPFDQLTGLPQRGAALVEVPQSHAYDFGLGPNLAFKVSDHWTLQGGAEFFLPAGGFGANRQGRITVNLGARFAYL